MKDVLNKVVVLEEIKGGDTKTEEHTDWHKEYKDLKQNKIVQVLMILLGFVVKLFKRRNNEKNEKAVV